jgi:hypothetical protein
MQGQSRKNHKPRERDWENSRERLTEARLAAIKATGQHRAAPQRPPGMTRLKTPPDTPRVARPQRQTMPSNKIRRRIILLGSVFAIAAIIACAIGVLLARGMIQSGGPATTMSDFFNAVSSNNYEQAYQDLGPAITIRLNQQDFIKQARDLDQRYGPITDYKEVANSATNQDSSQSYSFTITRSKLTKPYNLRITLQQDLNEGWKITDYGSSLGPGVGQ